MALHKRGLAELKLLAKLLDERELKALDTFIHRLLAQFDEERARAAKVEVIEERQTPKGTYRLQRIRCGKKGCKCAEGELHGPYWYRFWFEGGRTKSEYVGKKLPAR